MQNSDSPPDWKPLLEAVDYADSALGADAWGLMTQWNQAGLLQMRGRADGVTRKFKRRWFDFPARWGCDEPAPPLPDDETGARQLVGPGRTTSRPRRSALAPRIAARIEAPSPLRLYGSSDVLWFDQRAAWAKGVNVPRVVTGVLVDTAALRRLIREWQSSDADVAAAPVPAAAPELRRALDDKIHETISAVYNDAETRNMKPPNLKQIAAPVRKLLERAGLMATNTRIQSLAEDDRHKRRRRRTGARVNGTLLPFSDPEM